MTDGTGEQAQESNKAAILATAMNKEVLAKVLKHLNESELTRLMQVYDHEQANPTSDEAKLLAVGKEFLEATSRGATGHFKEALVLALGEDSAAQIFRRDRWRAIATRTRPAALAALLKDERPEAIGFVLGKLPAQYAAEVVGQLPTEIRAQSIERMSRNTSMPSAASDALARAIEEGLTSGPAESDQGAGNKAAAATLNQLEVDVAMAIIEQIRSTAADQAAAIEREMFHFESLLTLDARTLGLILGGVQTDRLTLALKGMPVEQRGILLEALSDQVKLIITQELEDSGRVPVSETRAARRDITNRALQMERDGKIRLRSDQQEMVS